MRSSEFTSKEDVLTEYKKIEVDHSFQLDGRLLNKEKQAIAFLNPTYQGLLGLLNKYEELRGQTIVGGQIVLWPAFNANHGTYDLSLKEQGLERDPAGFAFFISNKEKPGSPTWEIMLEPIFPGSPIQWAYSPGFPVKQEYKVLRRMLRMKINENKEDTLELPTLKVGDEIKIGRWKNRKATIKGFKKDKNNHPIMKTNKGDQQVFKARISKLMPEKLKEFKMTKYPEHELSSNSLKICPPKKQGCLIHLLFHRQIHSRL